MFRKATVILVLILLVSGARRGSRRPATKEDRIHRFQNFSCQSADAKAITAELCEVNANSSIDMVFDFVKPFEEIYITVATSVKKNDKFQQLHKTPIFEYCSFFSGAIANPLFKSLVDQVKSDGKMFHACPYKGVFSVRNFNVKDDMFFIIYPSGLYKSVATISRSKNIDDFTMTFIYEIKSRDFGKRTRQ